MSKLSISLVLTASLVALTGCPEDPYDPQTWIKKLDDPTEVKRAVTELSRLKDPSAIKALGDVWRKHNKWSVPLRTAVELAEQEACTDAQKEEKPGPDGKPQSCPTPPDVRERHGDGPYWDKEIVPILIEAVEEFDQADPRSIEDAAFAAEALGRSESSEAVMILINAVNKKIPKLSPAQRVRIASVRALGHFPKSTKAIETLVKVLGADRKSQPINLNAAAAMSLGDAKTNQGIEPLILSVFATPEIYPQARMALSKIGKPAVAPLLELLKGKHKALNAYASEQKFNKDCGAGVGPGSSCQHPGLLESKAAALLGDLRAKEAVPTLKKLLRQDAKISFFDPKTGAPGSPTHASYLDALLKIQDPASASAVYEFMKKPETDDLVRPQAINVYSMLSNNEKALGYLGGLVKDDEQEEAIRSAAAMAYGRLVHKESQLEPLNYMVKRYRDKAATLEAKAAKAKKEAEKEDLESQVQGYLRYAYFFEEQIARARPGIACKSDAKCYIELVGKGASDLIEELKLSSDKDIKKARKKGMVLAVRERSLLEVAKMGDKARDVLDDVLKLASTPERLVREPLLFALVRVPEHPCKKCMSELDRVLAEQAGQSRLSTLQHDTTVVRNYLEWAE